MRHEPPEMGDDAECDTIYAESALGAGGITVGADGIARHPAVGTAGRARIGHARRLPRVRGTRPPGGARRGGRRLR